eukprot:scpid63735/ scgid19909/ 
MALLCPAPGQGRGLLHAVRLIGFSRPGLSVRCASTGASTQALSLFNEPQLEHFHSHGFLKASGDFLTADERQNVIRWTAEMKDWPEQKGKWMKYFEKSPQDERVLCRVENFLPYHDGARDLVRGKITRAISELMGEEAILYKEKINFKLPGAKGFPPHQDAPAYITFGMDYHVTCMIAAEPATLENGCLELVPWKRDQGVLPHPEGSLPADRVSEWNRNNTWVQLTCEAGDVFFFSSLVPHRSQDNRSAERSRSIYYLTFNPLRDGDRRDGYYTDKRLQFPPDADKVPGVDYSQGAAIYNLSTPIPSRESA